MTSTRLPRPARPASLACLLAVLAPAAPSVAGSTVTFDVPTLDRWNYPFNFTPGTRGSTSVFASIFAPDFSEPDFDQRDGQLLVGFETAGAVAPGLGVLAYEVTAATLTVQLESDETFAYDPTPDPFTTFLPATDPEATIDEDAGRAVICSGVAYRNEFETMPFPENGPYAPGGQQFGKRIRNAYPVAYVNGTPTDISNNALDRFDPAPFGVGAMPVEPGTLVPEGTDVTFELDVADLGVQCYLREALDAGRVDLMVTSLHPTVQMGSGTFPVFYTKENLAVKFAGRLPARLSLDVEVAPLAGALPGDTNGDGEVNVGDLLEVLGAWGPCTCCAADVNLDGDVNVSDLLVVLGAWTG